MDSEDESSSSDMADWKMRMAKDRVTVYNIGRHAAFLRESSERLAGIRTSKRATRQQLLGLLNERQAHEAGLLRNLSDYFGPSFTTSYPTEHSSKAEEVFSTPELFELVLIHLHARDIFIVQQVSKNINDTIKQSGRIQRFIGLRADPNAYFNSPVSNSHWAYSESLPVCCPQHERSPYMFSIPGRHFSIPGPDELSINVSFDLRKPKLSGIGRACRSMLVCQPPVTELSAHVECCNGHGPRFPRHPIPPAERLPKPIRRETGITVGDVVDAAIEMIEEHQTCPWASEYQHDESGRVKVSPSFKGKLKLRPDDPALQAQARALAKAETWNQRDEANRRRMTAYINAKMVAFNAGQPIPTLQEFEAANAARSG
ncbi:hypothetical protein EJ03DRAFT_353894 [Teratosphaeria nubilosa]|uniref:F-box domain-containing protein n=1 Tax=Teratosphaeria nubilosa TaxID=161662 RepID=A0A6G1L0R7_9PEZI|nr:hypothetical protein EJ03DRAFT_353894 [Teratosphaeria nubilosa]